MATNIRIKGLDRAKAADGSPTSGSYRGFKVQSSLGQSYTGGTSEKAFDDVGSGDAGVKYTAKIGGAAGNNIQVAHVDPTGNNATLSVVVTYASGTGYPIITVNSATDGTSGITTTAAEAAAAVNADPEASQYVTATLLGTGASIIVAQAAANLATGANGTGTAEPFYLKVANNTSAVVDVENGKTARILKRNSYRWVSLGTV